MTEENIPSSGPVGDSAGEAWREVIAEFDRLGEAIGRWAKAAVNDPTYKDRAAEIKTHVDKIATSVSDAVDEATKTDVGSQFVDAANKTGEAFKSAGEAVSKEVGPRLAAAFGAAADRLHKAADRIEPKEGEAAQGEAAPDATAPASDPPSGDQ